MWYIRRGQCTNIVRARPLIALYNISNTLKLIRFFIGSQYNSFNMVVALLHLSRCRISLAAVFWILCILKRTTQRLVSNRFRGWNTINPYPDARCGHECVVLFGNKRDIFCFVVIHNKFNCFEPLHDTYAQPF